MKYRLINGNELAKTNLNVAKMPCIYAELPNGLDNDHYEVIKWHQIKTRKPTIEDLDYLHANWNVSTDEVDFVYDCELPVVHDMTVLITTRNHKVVVTQFYNGFDYPPYFDANDDMTFEGDEVLAWAYLPGGYYEK